ALALVATSLHGLTSNAHVVGNPDSTRAADLIAQAFPPTPAELARRVSDVIVVRSDRYSSASPEFHRLVGSLVASIRATGKVASVRSYLTGNRTLVAPDGHAALIQLLVATDDDIKPVVSLVERAGREPGFQAGITGDHTVGNDFGTQSQRDLKNGELAFGLPA